MNKFLVTYSLMEKCIASCEIPEQLEVMVDWIEYAMTKDMFPLEENVSAARSLLFKAILKQKEKIFDIDDEIETELKASSIHPQ